MCCSNDNGSRVLYYGIVSRFDCGAVLLAGLAFSVGTSSSAAVMPLTADIASRAAGLILILIVLKYYDWFLKESASH